MGSAQARAARAEEEGAGVSTTPRPRATTTAVDASPAEATLYAYQDQDAYGDTEAWAAGDGRIPYGAHRGWGARLGLGFVADPTMFLVDVSAPYDLGTGVSVGPRLQIGAASRRTYLAPSANLEYAHDLRSVVRGPLGRLRPLIGAGLGFAWLEKEDRRGDNDDVTFLVDLSTGVEYPLTDGFAVATVIDFNILPTGALGEDLIFTWQLIQLRAQF
ncbi:MAG: hypothetical protein R3F35_05890 [Myxococcota bacterium]